MALGIGVYAVLAEKAGGARVCKDAAGDGFDFVEAYVNKSIIAHDFRGPLSMYEKCGFDKYAEREGRAVMRKALK